ncbi:MAG: hypothetical protein AAGA11_06575 [Pseudomonadota bacterium]
MTTLRPLPLFAALVASIAAVPPASAATSLSARYVMQTENGWRLPTLGEDITYAVFYPSWYASLGGGEARADAVDRCDLVELSVGNHFSPQWLWALGAAQCEQQEDGGAGGDFSTYNLRLERLMADVEAPFNAYVGLGVKGASFDDEPPTSRSEDVEARANVGIQLRGKGRWALRLDHAQSAQGYKQSTLSLLAYFGGRPDAEALAPDTLSGDADTADSAQYLPAAPAVAEGESATLSPAPVEAIAVSTPETPAVVALDAPSTRTPAEASTETASSAPLESVLVETESTPEASTAAEDAAEPVLVQADSDAETEAEAEAEAAVPETEAANDTVAVAAVDATPEPTPAPAATAAPAQAEETGICPPLSRPLKSLAFNSAGELSAGSAEQLRALAGTLARRDNAIARIALPSGRGAEAAAANAVAVMRTAQPVTDGRVVGEVIDNLPVSVFELYLVKAGC